MSTGSMNTGSMSTGSAGQRSRRSGVTVTGNGSAATAVDQVVVTLGIFLVRQDAGEAFQAAAATVTRVLGILADDGADSRSVRTADLTLAPRTDFRDGLEVLLGYQAGQRLVVHLAGLAGLERMLTDVAMGGGEGVRIDSVELTPSDPEPALEQARAQAYADALAKAGQLAALAGRTLGELTWIDELPGQHGSGIRAARGLSRGGARTMPVATGDAEVSTSVTAHWSWAPE